MRKCKCFICGEEEHFAREYNRKQGNIARAAIMENLDLDDNWNVLSVDQGESDSDAICSLSEEEVGNARSITMDLEDFPIESAYMLTLEAPSWRKQPNLTQEMKNCAHQWVDNSDTKPGCERCTCCLEEANKRARAHCQQCHIILCPMCSKFVLERKIYVEPPSQKPYDNKDDLITELLNYVNNLLAENKRLQDQLDLLKLKTNIEYLEARDKRRMKGKKIVEEENINDEEEEPVYNPKLVIREAAHKISIDECIINTLVPEDKKGKKIQNGLYNMDLWIEIPEVKRFKVQAILDTGASLCCINQNAVPQEALEPSAHVAQINGVNSQQQVR